MTERILTVKKFLIIFFVLICIATEIPAKALPYVSYGYDNFGDAVPSQAGYIPEKVISYGFSEPKDLYFDGKRFYVADTGNNRIVVLSKDLDSVVKVYDRFTMPDGSETVLSQPEGVFVSEEYIYIADTGNNRVLVSEFDSEVVAEIEKPVSEVYDQKKTFQPKKVLADKAGNIYAVLGNMTTGCAMFSRQGEFIGFYGANRSGVNAVTIRNHFISEKKKSRRRRNIPTGISNFDIDGDFVYTCASDSEKTADIIKKLNAAGKNIFADRKLHFGDYQPKHNTGYSKTEICDIDISENGNINCLDAENGHIFQYDEECRLLFIMGNISGKSGGFESPSAIETAGNNIYVLDSGKNNITVFTETDFGRTVHEAVGMYNDGYYPEALDLWYDVLKYDGNYSYAHNGVAYALLRNGDYKSSMKYARLADYPELYDKAFEEYRREFLKSNAGSIFFAVIVAVIILMKKKRQKLSYGHYMLKYTVIHPFESFEDMRWKKSGSLKTSFIIIALFFFGVIAGDRLYGFQFMAEYDRTFNIIPYIIKSIVLFTAWTVGNWLICTLLDGEGTVRNICIYSAYALVPYVVQIYINVILSHVLVRDEYVFMQVIEIVGTVWSIIMIFSAVKAVHQYSVKKTFTAILLTVVAMLIMLLLLILLMVLLQQIWLFISAVCTEIIYRLRI